MNIETDGPADAPPLLLLNGLGTTTAMWQLQVDLLATQFRVIRFDIRGHGQGPAAQGDCSFGDLVADAFAVLDAVDVPRATLLGVSLGGMTALGMGLAAPNRVDRILCCAARADATPAFVQSWDQRLALLEKGGMEAVWQATVEKWLGPATRRDHAGREAALRDGFLATTPAGYRACAAALKRLEYLSALPRLSCRVDFVAGAADMAAPATAMQAMAEACQDGHYHAIPDAAHLLTLDQPDAFQSLLHDLLFP